MRKDKKQLKRLLKVYLKLHIINCSKRKLDLLFCGKFVLPFNVVMRITTLVYFICIMEPIMYSTPVRHCMLLLYIFASSMHSKAKTRILHSKAELKGKLYLVYPRESCFLYEFVQTFTVIPVLPTITLVSECSVLGNGNKLHQRMQYQ